MSRNLVSLKSLALACTAASLIGAGSAQAVTGVPRPMSGNTQGYIGSGLPIPIREGTPSCVPFGGRNGIKAIAGAMVTTFGGIGGSIRIPTSQFTLRGPNNPLAPQVQGVATQNPVALQVYTNFKIQVPNPGGTVMRGSGFAKKGGASGRTGVDKLSWCPGYTMTVTNPFTTMGMFTPMAGNPGCVNPGAHKAISIYTCGASPNPCPGPNKKAVVIPGFMKYTRTGKMLGGPGRTTLQGKFDVAIGATGGGAFFIKGEPPPSAAVGMSFGFYFQMNAGKGPQHAPIMRNSCGIINSIGPQILSKAASNKTTGSFGGPATQGMITVKADTGLGYESYKLTGYDNRTAMGKGKLQLVSGSIGLRSLTGENANRGIVLYDVPEPGAIAGAAIALVALFVCHRAIQRRSK